MSNKQMQKRRLRVIRLPKVCEKTNLSKPSIYRGMETGDFPKARKLGKRAVGWIEAEIDDWIETRPEA